MLFILTPGLTPTGVHLAGPAAGGPGGDRGAGPAGDGHDEPEELARPVRPRVGHAAPCPCGRRPVPGKYGTTYEFPLRHISQRRPWESHDSSGMLEYIIPEASLTLAF